MSELRFTSNRAGAYRDEQWQGRDYLVLPVVAIVAGVLNGEYVPLGEIEASVGSWNGRPVTLGHPTDDGAFISANAPAVLDRYQVGHLFNTSLNQDRLKAEAWISLDLAGATEDGRTLLTQAREGAPIEVSTAYYRYAREKPGEVDGQAYNAIATDLKPDHLAVLLHEKGACSWEDGCGIRANEGGESIPAQFIQALRRALRLGGNEESLNERVRRVHKAVYDAVGTGGEEEIYVREVYEDRAIVEQGDKLYAYSYTEDDDGIQVGEGVEVEVQYIPLGESDDDAESTPEQEETMTNQLVIDVATRYSVDAEALEGLDEATLTALQEYQEDVPEPEVPCAELQALAAFAEERGGLEALMQNLQAEEQRRDTAREALVAELAENERCAFTREQLEGMDESHLMALRNSLWQPDYSGMPDFAARTQGGEVVEMPALSA